MEYVLPHSTHFVVRDTSLAVDVLPEFLRRHLYNVFRFIYRRDFQPAELAIVKVVEKMLKTTRPDEITKSNNRIFLQIVYYDFNAQYLQWVVYKKKDRKKEIEELYSKERSNYLVAHAQGVAEMDDLIYSALSYYYDDPAFSYEDVADNLSCYKKLYLKSYNHEEELE